MALQSEMENKIILHTVSDIPLEDHPLTVGHGVASKLKEHGVLYSLRHKQKRKQIL